MSEQHWISSFLKVCVHTFSVATFISWVLLLLHVMSSGGVRLRGGRQQRKRALEVVHPDDESEDKPEGKRKKIDSGLALDLLQKWAFGSLSAAGVQDLAHKAWTDQCKLLQSLGHSADHAQQSLKSLAKLGRGGRLRRKQYCLVRSTA